MEQRAGQHGVRLLQDVVERSGDPHEDGPGDDLRIELSDETQPGLGLTPMDSGYWWVSRASRAVKLQSPAVKRIKNGSSFLG